MKNYWLVKSEPDTYGFGHLSADKTGMWDGVRNYQARNFMNEMKAGDQVLFYHSGKKREIVGTAEVIKEAYPDPTATDNKGWVAVNLQAAEKFAHPVALDDIKADAFFEDMLLLKQSRLSVMPVSSEQFDKIRKMGQAD